MICYKKVLPKFLPSASTQQIILIQNQKPIHQISCLLLDVAVEFARTHIKLHH